VRPIVPEAVMAALSAKFRGAVGFAAAMIDTSDESAPNPAALRAVTLKV